MGDPIRFLLTNAGSAGLIALLAWGASLTLRRHSVVHGLWLLALLRLVTPPIAPLPLVPAWPGLGLRPGPAAPVVVAMPPATVNRRAMFPLSDEPIRLSAHGAARAAVTSAPAPLAAGQLPRGSSASGGLGWRAAAWLALAAGGFAISLLTAWRFARFGRLLDCARPAPPAIAERAAALAVPLGLRRTPPVLLVPARVPPMLWPHRGGPRLLLPAGLLADLHAEELDALLAHELAHVRRRDHWVRLVEVAATALFWWYPVTWWARRALRRAEERCCDEWVLRLLPRSAEAYASGLVKSLTFVSETPLPAVASGAGPVEDLEARLKEILMTRPVPQLAAPLRLALAVGAVFGLAVFPTHAQSSAVNEETPAPATAAKPAAAPAPAARSLTPRPSTAPRGVTPRASAAPRSARRPVALPHGVLAGVPGGVVGGVPGGVVGGVPGGIVGAGPALSPRASLGPTPQVEPAPGAAPRAAGDDPRATAEQRAIDDQRRAIEEKRRKLHEQEMDLERQALEIEARSEQAQLNAEAARLRADGKADDAARVEKQVHLSTQRVELQKRQLQLEMEHSRLEAEVDAAARDGEERAAALEAAGKGSEAEALRAQRERLDVEHQRAGEELEKRQHALEAEMEQAEKQIQALEAEQRVQDLRSSTDDLARSMEAQIASLKEALPEAAAQKADVEREIERLQAALDALKSGATPTALRRKTPRPQP